MDEDEDALRSRPLPLWLAWALRPVVARPIPLAA